MLHQSAPVVTAAYQFGKEDARNRAICCPETLFVQRRQQVEYCRGYVSVAGHNDTTSQFLNQTRLTFS